METSSFDRQCTTDGCCGDTSRREFLHVVGLGGVAALAAGLPAVAGPFEGTDFEKLVPADKKLRPEWLVGILVGGGWLVVVTAYFVAFWSTTGQTPGMRLMQLRVTTRSDGSLRVVRSLVRLVGLALAIIPLFAGFLPVLVDRRRRALQDFVAGTVVLYDESSRSSRRDDVAEGERSEVPAERLEVGPNTDERTVVDGCE